MSKKDKDWIEFLIIVAVIIGWAFLEVKNIKETGKGTFAP